MGQNIIIFGGTGFFGTAFISELKKNKSNYVCLVVRSLPDSYLPGECVLYSEIDTLIGDGRIYDLAIDFSSHVSVDDFFANPQKAFLDNLEIPINNIKYLNKLEFSGRYIYISTDRAVLDISHVDFISSLKIPNDPYGASKLVGEIIVRYSYSLGVDAATIVRFPNLYGPGQKSRQLIPAIVERLKKGLSVIELATLNGCRNYLFITDAVSALMKLINNIGIESDICVSGENVRIEKIVELFQKIQKEKVGSTVQFIAKSSKSPRASFKSPPDIMDDSIFREKYDWSPKVSIHQGILLTMELES
tara:strand:+ start:592 stop:1503 length:912 start_codon:yes stop_codon:yes gene_type:complete